VLHPPVDARVRGGGAPEDVVPNRVNNKSEDFVVLVQEERDSDITLVGEKRRQRRQQCCLSAVSGGRTARRLAVGSVFQC